MLRSAWYDASQLMQREQSPLVQSIEPFEDAFRKIRCRWYYLTAMHAELEKASRGKPFRVMHSIAWQMAFDSNHMLVIELASWVKRQGERGGLFGLMESRLSELERKFPKQRKRRVGDSDLVRYDTEAHETAVRRLFPDSAGRIAQGRDVDALRSTLEAECQHLVDDRNCNRAHPLETPQGEAARVGLEGLGALFERLEGILNDVRLIADWTTTSFHDMNATPADSAAEDFVDAVLIGTSSRRLVVMGGLDRDAYYARLHALHDADPDKKPDVHFNEYEVEPVDDAVRRLNALTESRGG